MVNAGAARQGGRKLGGRNVERRTRVVDRGVVGRGRTLGAGLTRREARGEKHRERRGTQPHQDRQ
jgi:hypothetical protein